MREKLERLVCNAIREAREFLGQPVSDRLTTEILSLMREDITKVRSENPYSADEDTDEFFAFDSACVKVLKALEGMHDQSNTRSD